MDYDFCTHENKTNWRVSPKRQRRAAAKDFTCLSRWLRSAAVTDWTIEPLNQKSQIAQEYGMLPADARQQLVLGK